MQPCTAPNNTKLKPNDDSKTVSTNTADQLTYNPSNQPNLSSLLTCSITDIIWDFIPLFTTADYFNMTVSNKKALATLDTVHKWT